MDEEDEPFPTFDAILQGQNIAQPLQPDFSKLFPKSAPINTKTKIIKQYVQRVKELFTKSQGNDESLHRLLEAGLSDLLAELVSYFGDVAYQDDTTPLLDEILETISVIAGSEARVLAVVICAVCGPLIQLLINNVCTFLQKTEICRSLNILLEPCPFAVKETLLKQEAFINLLAELFKLIIRIGDYEFQIGVLECIFRLVPRKVRSQYASKFIEGDSLDKFLQICDANFETDCRIFLNDLNRTIGKNTRVYSIPCEKAVLGQKLLRKPSDENYEEFWIDFNYGTRRVTLFCEQDVVEVSSQESQEADLWETVSVPAGDVKTFSYTENGATMDATIVLKRDISSLYPNLPQCIGRTFSLTCLSNFNLRRALLQIFGTEKCTTRKVSSVCTPVRISLKGDRPSGFQSPYCQNVEQEAENPYAPIPEVRSNSVSSTRQKMSVPCAPITMKSDPLLHKHGTGKERTPQKPVENYKNTVTPSKGVRIQPKKVKTPVVEICPKKTPTENISKKDHKNKIVKETEGNNEEDDVIPDSLPVFQDKKNKRKNLSDSGIDVTEMDPLPREDTRPKNEVNLDKNVSSKTHLKAKGADHSKLQVTKNTDQEVVYPKKLPQNSKLKSKDCKSPVESDDDYDKMDEEFQLAASQALSELELDQEDTDHTVSQNTEHSSDKTNCQTSKKTKQKIKVSQAEKCVQQCREENEIQDEPHEDTVEEGSRHSSSRHGKKQKKPEKIVEEDELVDAGSQRASRRTNKATEAKSNNSQSKPYMDDDHELPENDIVIASKNVKNKKKSANEEEETQKEMGDLSQASSVGSSSRRRGGRREKKDEDTDKEEAGSQTRQSKRKSRGKDNTKTMIASHSDVPLPDTKDLSSKQLSKCKNNRNECTDTVEESDIDNLSCEIKSSQHSVKHRNESKKRNKPSTESVVESDIDASSVEMVKPPSNNRKKDSRIKNAEENPKESSHVANINAKSKKSDKKTDENKVSDVDKPSKNTGVSKPKHDKKQGMKCQETEHDLPDTDSVHDEMASNNEESKGRKSSKSKLETNKTSMNTKMDQMRSDKVNSKSQKTKDKSQISSKGKELSVPQTKTFEQCDMNSVEASEPESETYDSCDEGISNKGKQSSHKDRKGQPEGRSDRSKNPKDKKVVENNKGTVSKVQQKSKGKKNVNETFDKTVDSTKHRVLPGRRAKKDQIYDENAYDEKINEYTSDSDEVGYLFRSPEEANEKDPNKCRALQKASKSNKTRLLSQSGLYFPELNSNASTDSDPYNFDTECDKEKEMPMKLKHPREKKEINVSTTKFFKHRAETKKHNQTSETIATTYMKTWHQTLNKKKQVKSMSKSMVTYKTVNEKEIENENTDKQTKKKSRKSNSKGIFSATQVSECDLSFLEERTGAKSIQISSGSAVKKSRFKLFNPDLSVLMSTEDADVTAKTNAIPEEPNVDMAEHLEMLPEENESNNDVFGESNPVMRKKHDYTRSKGRHEEDEINGDNEDTDEENVQPKKKPHRSRQKAQLSKLKKNRTADRQDETEESEKEAPRKPLRSKQGNIPDTKKKQKPSKKDEQTDDSDMESHLPKKQTRSKPKKVAIKQEKKVEEDSEESEVEERPVLPMRKPLRSKQDHVPDKHHKQRKQKGKVDSPDNNTCESNVVDNFSTMCKNLIEQSSMRDEESDDENSENEEQSHKNSSRRNSSFLPSDQKSEISWLTKKSTGKKRNQKTYKGRHRLKGRIDDEDKENAIEKLRFRDEPEEDLIMSSQEWEANSKRCIDEGSLRGSNYAETPKITSAKRRYSPLDVKLIATPKTPRTVESSLHFSDDDHELYVEEDDYNFKIAPVTPKLREDVELPLQDTPLHIERQDLRSGPSSTIRPSQSSLKRKYSHLDLDDEDDDEEEEEGDQSNFIPSQEMSVIQEEDEEMERSFAPKKLFRLDEINVLDEDSEQENSQESTTKHRSKSSRKSNRRSRHEPRLSDASPDPTSITESIKNAARAMKLKGMSRKDLCPSGYSPDSDSLMDARERCLRERSVTNFYKDGHSASGSVRDRQMAKRVKGVSCSENNVTHFSSNHSVRAVQRVKKSKTRSRTDVNPSPEHRSITESYRSVRSTTQRQDERWQPEIGLSPISLDPHSITESLRGVSKPKKLKVMPHSELDTNLSPLSSDHSVAESVRKIEQSRKSKSKHRQQPSLTNFSDLPSTQDEDGTTICGDLDNSGNLGISTFVQAFGIDIKKQLQDNDSDRAKPPFDIARKQGSCYQPPVSTSPESDCDYEAQVGNKRALKRSSVGYGKRARVQIERTPQVFNFTDEDEPLPVHRRSHSVGPRQSETPHGRNDSSRDRLGVILTRLTDRMSDMENRLMGAISELKGDIKAKNELINKLIATNRELEAKTRHSAPKPSNDVKAVVRQGFVHAEQDRGMSVHTETGLNQEATDFAWRYSQGAIRDVKRDEFDAAVARHMLTKKEKASREKTGTSTAHRETVKKYNRKQTKSRQRVIGITKSGLPDPTIKKLKSALSDPNYMSSEESAIDEEGHRCFTVRPIPWQSEELKNGKAVADKSYLNIRPNSRARIRRQQGTSSLKPAPGIPENLRWILKDVTIRHYGVI